MLTQTLSFKDRICLLVELSQIVLQGLPVVFKLLDSHANQSVQLLDLILATMRRSNFIIKEALVAEKHVADGAHCDHLGLSVLAQLASYRLICRITNLN